MFCFTPGVWEFVVWGGACLHVLQMLDLQVGMANRDCQHFYTNIPLQILYFSIIPIISFTSLVSFNVAKSRLTGFCESFDRTHNLYIWGQQ